MKPFAKPLELVRTVIGGVSSDWAKLTFADTRIAPNSETNNEE